MDGDALYFSLNKKSKYTHKADKEPTGDDITLDTSFFWLVFDKSASSLLLSLAISLLISSTVFPARY